MQHIAVTCLLALKTPALTCSTEDPSAALTDSFSTCLAEGSRSSTSEKKKILYKLKLTYRQQWESKYPWVYCEDPKKGMFCHICQKFGKPPDTAHGAWICRGVCNRSHAVKDLKAHIDSQWHRDAAVAARMAEQPSALELQQAAVARHHSKLRANNRVFLLQLSTFWLSTESLTRLLCKTS